MNKYRALSLAVGDTLCFLLALILMVWIETNSTLLSTIIVFYAKAFVIPLLLTLLVCYVINLYELDGSVATPRSVGRFLFASALSGISIALFFYLFPSFGISPKTNLAILSATFFILVVGWRRLFFRLFAHTASRRVYFIGESPETLQLCKAFELHPHVGHSVGTAKNFDEYLAQPTPVDLLILSRDIGVQDIERAARIGTPLVTVRSAFEDLFGKIPLAHLTPDEAFTLLEKSSNHSHSFIYRFFEILVASLVLIISSPFLLFAALAIAIEDGRPILYYQERIGLNGKHFLVYKLRTMKKNAEQNGAQWAEKNDNRTTKVGKILRKLHIDEIPQMWNIIRGDIALVGPRPERPQFVAELEQQIPFYFLRHTVKPGFTGWAQIKYRYARSVDDSREKFEYDLYYVRNRNLLLDLGILVKTVQIIFTH